MQRIAGVAVTDVALMGPFCEFRAHNLALAGGGDTGKWGVGWFSRGETLVRRSPARRPLDLGAVLGAVRTRHAVCVVDDESGGRLSMDDAQPLRYRDWLFGQAGGEGLPTQIVAEIRQSQLDTALGRRDAVTPGEAVMMCLMGELYARGARDHANFTTDALRAAFGTAAGRLRRWSSETQRPLEIAIIIHRPGLLFGLSLGRALHVARFHGLGPHGQRGAPPPSAHLRGAIITDHPVGEGPWESIAPWSGVEIGEDCEIKPFPLSF